MFLAFIVYFIIYIGACVVCMKVGENREIGSARAFWFSMLFTPFIGIILVSISPKDESSDLNKQWLSGRISDKEYFRRKKELRK